MELVMASLADWFGQIWNLIKYTTIIQFGAYHLSVLDVAIWLFILDIVADFIVNLLSFGAGESVKSIGSKMVGLNRKYNSIDGMRTRIAKGNNVLDGKNIASNKINKKWW